MVGMLMTPADVAVYFATVKTMALVHFVFFAVKAGVANQFAARIEDKDKSVLCDLARRSTTWTFWPSLAMGIIVLLAGPWLLAMFGAAFTDGYPLLFIMVLGVVIRSSIGPAESLLNMSGNQNICAAVFGCVLAINIALNFALIPRCMECMALPLQPLLRHFLRRLHSTPLCANVLGYRCLHSRASESGNTKCLHCRKLMSKFLNKYR
ncbi:MAG: lipopolysaccharide biosynthesis protein [Ahrensia sp.]|nr:lipopolysaccharide biosynthesis protein [Ahrensia sp.]